MVLIGKEHFADSRDPLGVPVIGLGPYGELAVEGVEADAYRVGLVVPVLHAHAAHSGDEGREALLPVDDQAIGPLVDLFAVSDLADVHVVVGG